MERIQVTVDDVVPGDPDDAFDIMTRFDKYHEWWPQGLPVDCVLHHDDFIESKLLIRPYPLVNVGWKLHSYSAPREIIIHYYQGMHTGMGVWTFSEADNGKAVISFEIDILPKNRIFDVAYKVFNVRKSHIKHVKMVISALAERMRQMNPSQERIADVA